MFRRNLQSAVQQKGGRKIASVNIWNLLWLSGRLIICTEQRNIHISTFSNVVTSEKVINHEISIYFSINAIVALCH